MKPGIARRSICRINGNAASDLAENIKELKHLCSMSSFSLILGCYLRSGNFLNFHKLQNSVGEMPVAFLKVALKYASDEYPRDSLISETEKLLFFKSSFA